MTRQTLLPAALLASSLLAATAGLAQLPTAASAAKDLPPASATAKATASTVNAATARIYRAVAATQTDTDNVFVSPAGLILAGALLREGSSGQTLEQIDAALGYAGMEAPVTDLAELSGEIASDTDAARLIISNAVFFDDGYTLRKAYKKSIAPMDAETRALPILSDPKSTAASLNQWVSKTTRGLISGLVQPDDLRDVVAVLANTVYFKSVWEVPFGEEATAPAAFATPDGAKNVPTMRQLTDHSWRSEDGLTVLHLPYKNDRYRMVIAMPEDGDVSALEAGLDGDMIADWLDATQVGDTPLEGDVTRPGATVRTDLHLPKWEFGATYDLERPLSALGMASTFTDAAQIDRIVDRRLKLSKAVQGTKIIVDEEGTEAAATTMMYAVPVSAPPPPVELRIDRPFLYMIAETRTDTVLFMGRVMDPTRGDAG